MRNNLTSVSYNDDKPTNNSTAEHKARNHCSWKYHTWFTVVKHCQRKQCRKHFYKKQATTTKTKIPRETLTLTVWEQSILGPMNLQLRHRNQPNSFLIDTFQNSPHFLWYSLQISFVLGNSMRLWELISMLHHWFMGTYFKI